MSGMLVAKVSGGDTNMKKFLISISCLLALSIAAIPVGAQTRTRYQSNSRYDQRSSRRYDSRDYRNESYRNDVYNGAGYGSNDSVYRASNNYSGYSNDSVWNQHRDKITTAGGAVVGAIVGGVVGGKRGAIIGAVAGGGAAALYTYKIRDKY